jgi:hypothetical protein
MEQTKALRDLTHRKKEHDMAKTEDELLAESLAEEQRQIQEYVDKTAAEKGLSAEERENFLDSCRKRVAAERAKWPQRLSEVPLPDPAAPWSKYECEFQYEILQDTIYEVEAICSWQVIAEEKKPNPDQALIQFWLYEGLRLNREIHDLKIDDEAGIRRLDALYTPVVRYMWKEVRRCLDEEKRSWHGDPPIWFGPERWMRDHATDGLAPPGFPHPDDPGFKPWALTFQYQIACLTIDSVKRICEDQIYREKEKPNPDTSLIELWEAEKSRLEAEKCSLDPLDEAAFQRVRESYMPVGIAEDWIWKAVNQESKYDHWNGDPPIWYGPERWLAEHGANEPDPSNLPSPDDFQYQIARNAIYFVTQKCSRQISKEERKPNPDTSLIELWKAEQDRLAAEERSLDPADVAEARRIRALYTPFKDEYERVRSVLSDEYFERERKAGTLYSDSFFYGVVPVIWYGVERWFAEHGTDEGIARPDASKKGA